MDVRGAAQRETWREVPRNSRMKEDHPRGFPKGSFALTVTIRDTITEPRSAPGYVPEAPGRG